MSQFTEFIYKLHTNQNIHSETVQQIASGNQQQLLTSLKQMLVTSFTVIYQRTTAEFHLPFMKVMTIRGVDPYGTGGTCPLNMMKGGNPW